jgi:hypothetical protein
LDRGFSDANRLAPAIALERRDARFPRVAKLGRAGFEMPVRPWMGPGPLGARIGQMLLLHAYSAT